MDIVDVKDVCPARHVPGRLARHQGRRRESQCLEFADVVVCARVTVEVERTQQREFTVRAEGQGPSDRASLLVGLTGEQPVRRYLSSMMLEWGAERLHFTVEGAGPALAATSAN
ncbi:hypothetical protein IW249_006436 [Micromonospora vinacea]|uniref:Uncharacterized protein n=1 Tax=Micromonospora vinacea TaxID=709878 RepID=A0ABS0KBL5_9ACTN|nr:hypothetical protein [Micromonospora vinacea]MBG6106022.1 hypothetical protein [Micromonospora vinacea]WTA65734.1 hypothetical protein OHB51_24955 [Micromonospora sp. NBC_00855]